MTKRLLSLVLLLTLFEGRLTAATVATDREPGIDRTLRLMTGIEAFFVHSFRPQGSKKDQVESGRVIFGSLPSMRWEYEAFEKKTFVFDGNRSWFYVPAERQVSITDLKAEQKTSYPFLFLNDRVTRDRNFRVRERASGGAVTTRLEPLDRSNSLKEIILVAGSDGLLRSIEYRDRSGNRTSFQFGGYRRVQLTPDTFRFITPAGVQVVGP